LTNDLSPQTLRRLIILVIIILVGLPVSIGIYSSSDTIPAYTNPYASATIDNPEILQDTLPQTVVNVVTQKVLTEATTTNNTQALPYHVKSTVTKLEGDYDFTLVPSDNSGDLPVEVRVDDNFGLMSVTTTFGATSTPTVE
jgi:hypothetical protein